MKNKNIINEINRIRELILLSEQGRVVRKVGKEVLEDGKKLMRTLQEFDDDVLHKLIFKKDKNLADDIIKGLRSNNEFFLKYFSKKNIAKLSISSKLAKQETKKLITSVINKTKQNPDDIETYIEGIFKFVEDFVQPRYGAEVGDIVADSMINDVVGRLRLQGVDIPINLTRRQGPIIKIPKEEPKKTSKKENIILPGYRKLYDWLHKLNNKDLRYLINDIKNNPNVVDDIKGSKFPTLYDIKKNLDKLDNYRLSRLITGNLTASSGKMLPKFPARINTINNAARKAIYNIKKNPTNKDNILSEFNSLVDEEFKDISPELGDAMKKLYNQMIDDGTIVKKTKPTNIISSIKNLGKKIYEFHKISQEGKGVIRMLTTLDKRAILKYLTSIKGMRSWETLIKQSMAHGKTKIGFSIAYEIGIRWFIIVIGKALLVTIYQLFFTDNFEKLETKNTPDAIRKFVTKRLWPNVKLMDITFAVPMAWIIRIAYILTEPYIVAFTNEGRDGVKKLLKDDYNTLKEESEKLQKDTERFMEENNQKINSNKKYPNTPDGFKNFIIKKIPSEKNPNISVRNDNGTKIYTNTIEGVNIDYIYNGKTFVKYDK